MTGIVTMIPLPMILVDILFVVSGFEVILVSILKFEAKVLREQHRQNLRVVVLSNLNKRSRDSFQPRSHPICSDSAAMMLAILKKLGEHHNEANTDYEENRRSAQL